MYGWPWIVVFKDLVVGVVPDPDSVDPALNLLL
jgi:hypothetical protein